MAVNLLPWREQHHKQAKQKLFVAVGIVVCVVLIICLSWNWQIKRNLVNQQVQIKEWHRQTEEQTKKLEDMQKFYNHANHQNNHLRSFAADNKIFLSFLQKLPVMMPLDLYITEISQVERSMQIIGYAGSSDGLFKFEKSVSALKENIRVHLAQIQFDQNQLKFNLEIIWN